VQRLSRSGSISVRHDVEIDVPFEVYSSLSDNININMLEVLAGTVGYPLLRRKPSEPPHNHALRGNFWGLLVWVGWTIRAGAAGAGGRGQVWVCQWLVRAQTNQLNKLVWSSFAIHSTFF